MQTCKYIGKIIMDYTYYKGQDLYSDGPIEDELLETVKGQKQKEVLYSSDNWPILYHLSDIRENLLEWYPFSENASLLEIGSGCGALTGLFSRKVKDVTCIELSEKRSLINAYRNRERDNVRIMIGNFRDMKMNNKYDYVTLIGVWEYAGLYVGGDFPYLKMLNKIKQYLKENGKIIIAIENKTGFKYWNGAPEDHTGDLYGGLNDYIDSSHVRTFSKQEIEQMLCRAGISEFVFYYPMPDYKLPEVIYSDEILPRTGSERNYGKDYSACRVYNFYDDIVFDQICRDGMFSYFANSFLVVTGEEQIYGCYGKYNKIRKEQYRIKTQILKKNHKKYVRKSALNSLALEHISNLGSNKDKCEDCLPNIKYAEGKLKDSNYYLSYIEGTDLDVIFYEYRNNIELFIKKFCYYVEEYLKPSEESMIPFSVSNEFVCVFGSIAPLNQMSLRYTNIDLIFSNLKLTEDNQLYCFDCEWVFDFLIPYEYVIWRSAVQLFMKYMVYLKKHISKNEFLLRVGFKQENLLIYEKMEKNFHNYVYGNEDYLKKYRKSSVMQQLNFK